MKHLLPLFLMLNTIMMAAELKVLDKPMWVFPGQRFRICIAQEKGAGTLNVTYPQEALKLFARWDKDSDQRFYFTAETAGVQKLVFDGKGGHLEMDVEVIPWADVYAPRKYGSVVLPRIWPMDAPYQESVKSRRTLLDDKEYEEHIRGYRGKSYMHFNGLTDEQVFNMIPGPAVARTCLMVIGNEPYAKEKGCPVCGTDIYKGRSGFYPWVLDRNLPWKVKCPNCKTVFPSNDWANGDMSSGDFPDDGFGCEPVKPVLTPGGQPQRFPFIAYYHQTQAYMRQFTPGIPEAAYYGIANNDKEAIHKAAIALFRYAESMLDMALNMNHRKIPNRDGILRWPVGAPIPSQKSPETFLYIQPNWDTPIMEKMALVWDCLFDKLDDDKELIEFCQKHHHPEITDITAFKRFIDAGVLRVQIQAAMDNKIARNYPQQESTALTLALAYGTDASLDVADWLLNQKGIRFALTNQYYKDGHAHESPSYNSIQINDLGRLFDNLERMAALFPNKFLPPKFISPRNDPKYRLQFDAPLDFGLIGRHQPDVGDTGGYKRPTPLNEHQGYPLAKQNFITAYKYTGDERFLQAIYGPNGTGTAHIKDKELVSKIEEAGKRLGWQVQVPTNFQDGYGMAFLRSGREENQRAAWLRYKRVLQHAHVDMLTWGYAAIKRDLTPELGYPIGWSYARDWEFSWGTHYETHITGISSVEFFKGCLTAFVPAKPIQVAVAEAYHQAKPSDPKDAYRERTLILVDVSPEDSYVLTLERVRGGTEHTVSFHTQEGEVKTNITFTPYEGTALGTGLKYGDFASEKDRDLACLSYMKNPASATFAGPLQMDLEFPNQPHTGTRMFALMPPNATTIKANASPPGGGNNAYNLTWFITKVKGEENMAGQYLHIMNPYTQEPCLDRLEVLPVQSNGDSVWQPLAIRIHGKEFTDTFILQHENGVLATADGLSSDGIVGFMRHKDGQCIASTLIRGTILTSGKNSAKLASPSFNARIAACDWKARTITLDALPPENTLLQGRHVRIYNEFDSDTSYLIKKAETVDGKCILTLDLDARIGEGFVHHVKDSGIHTITELPLAYAYYYIGKLLVNEKGDQSFTIKAAWYNDVNIHTAIPKNEMAKIFTDANGDGNIQFTIYDYAPGDNIQIDFFAATQQ